MPPLSPASRMSLRPTRFRRWSGDRANGAQHESGYEGTHPANTPFFVGPSGAKRRAANDRVAIPPSSAVARFFEPRFLRLLRRLKLHTIRLLHDRHAPAVRRMVAHVWGDTW